MTQILGKSCTGHSRRPSLGNFVFRARDQILRTHLEQVPRHLTPKAFMEEGQSY